MLRAMQFMSGRAKIRCWAFLVHMQDAVYRMMWHHLHFSARLSVIRRCAFGPSRIAESSQRPHSLFSVTTQEL